MAIIFRYKHVKRKDGFLRKAPFIPIFLRDRNDKLYEFTGLIDSGADFTLIPKDLADFLGLKLGKGETTAGIGGSAKVRNSKMNLTIKNQRERYNLEIPVLILMENYADVPILLGRNGFFDNFHINFRQDEEKITLKKVQPKEK